MILLKQALRSVWRGRRAYIACLVLLGIGIAVYVSFNLLFRNLSAAMDNMYEKQRFGEVFAQLGGIPRSDVDKVAELPGVAALQATVVADARVEREDSTRIAALRLASIDLAESERINDFLLVAGALPGEDGILIGEAFAAANGIAPGDGIKLVIGGREVEPVVSGIVQSPEYVYAIPDSGQLMPDDEAFGFGYMPVDRLEVLAGKTGVATNLSMLLAEGISFQNMKYQLEDVLAPYGVKALYERKDQPSHAMLKQEIDSIGSMATSLPMVFILMAVIILYIMLKRIIEQERMQIGTLKAFGFSDRAILGHYLIYGGLTGTVGGILGVVCGLWMTDGMSAIYMEYFHLPAIRVPPEPVFIAVGFAIALAAGLAGAYFGARGVLRLNPAEAMRAPTPPMVHGDAIGRIPALRALLASYGYMAVRNITRNRFRSAFVLVGMAFSFALTAFMASFGEMFDALMLDQFTKVERYNVKVSLEAPMDPATAIEAAVRLNGVRSVEGILEMPVELRRENRKETVSVTAVRADSSLYHLYDSELRRNLSLPPGGAVLSSSLADKLGARRGDVLMLCTPYTGDDEYPVPVLGVIHSNLGATAYMQLDTLYSLLQIPPTVTGLLVDTADAEEIRTSLIDAEQVSAMANQTEMKKVYTDMLDTYGVMIYMLQLAGVAIAFAIITNTASISLSERKREYATMRVLGMHPAEIARVVGFEYWVLSAAALPFGIALTRLLKVAMAGMINNDVFSIPLYTAPSSFATAAVLCGLTVFLSNRMAQRKIARFDMVEVLKERE